MSRKEDLAWLAGFWDGEGHIGIMKGKAPYVTGRLVIGHTDKELLLKVKRILGVGKIYGPYKAYKENHKQRWSFRVHKKDEVLEAFRSFEPWLGKAKRNQAKEVFKVVNQYRKELNNRGPRCGHQYDIVDSVGQRRCSRCRKQSARKLQEIRRKLEAQ